MIGDLFYPNDPALAKETNSDLRDLQRWNALHNQLVNVYTGLAQQIRSFNSFPMSILVLQYHLIYTAEDLDNLPPADNPKIAESTVKLVESAALDVLSVKMATGAVRAMVGRVANVYRESGTFRSNIGKSSAELTEDAAENLAEGLVADIDQVAGQTDLLAFANVDFLTDTDLSNDALSSLAD